MIHFAPLALYFMVVMGVPLVASILLLTEWKFATPGRNDIASASPSAAAPSPDPVEAAEAERPSSTFDSLLRGPSGGAMKALMNAALFGPQPHLQEREPSASPAEQSPFATGEFLGSVVGGSLGGWVGELLLGHAGARLDEQLRPRPRSSRSSRRASSESPPSASGGSAKAARERQSDRRREEAPRGDV